MKREIWVILAYVLFIILVLLLYFGIAKASPGWSDPYISYAGCDKIVVEWPDHPVPLPLPADFQGFIKMMGEEKSRRMEWVGDTTLETNGGFPLWSENVIEWGFIVTKDGGWIGVVNTPYTFTCVPEYSSYLPMVIR